MTDDEREHALIRAAISGDDDAISQLLAREGGTIRAHVEQSIQAKWRSILDADDVMQVTYLEAFLRVSQFENRGPGAFRGWLRRIADNNLRDAIRELERLKRPQPDRRIVDADIADTTVALLENLCGTTTTPSRAANHADFRVMLDAALGRLPDDYSAVIRLYDLDGRSIEDVARSLGRSPGAVFMLRARAHERLRESLGPATQFFTHAT